MHITYWYPQQPAITFIVVSSFLVLAIYRYMPACVLCKHYAGGTCILHCCALFNNYYTRLPSHQLHLHKRRKKLRVSLPLFYIIVFWPFDNFPDGISRMSCKGSVKHQETWFTSIVYTTRLYVFGKEDEETYEINRRFVSFEYTQRSNEFEPIHNTPEK